MAAAHGTVRVCQEGQTVTFQVHDRATMVQSHAFRRRVKQFQEQGATRFYIDLRHCTHIDSTFMGTLLFLKRDMDRCPSGELVLVSPSPSCKQVFQQMGVLELFPVQATEESERQDWEEIPASPEDLNTIKVNVTQAHQELANLPGATGEEFRGVMRFLSRSRDEKAQ